MRLRKAVASLLVLLAIIACARALTTISSCPATLNVTGETYRLTQNLSVSAGSAACITIFRSGTTLDCDGYWIIGNGTSTGVKPGNATVWSFAAGSGDSAYDVFFDAGYVYTVGDYNDGTNYGWNVRKFNATTAAPIWNYHGKGPGTINGIYVSSGFVYAAGWDYSASGSEWRLEKLYASNGSNVWNYTSDPFFTANDDAQAVFVDSGYVYLTGTTNAGYGGLRVEKINADTKASVWNYTSTTTGSTYSLYVNSGYVYIGGHNGGWHVEKLNTATNTSVWKYSSTGTGYVMSVFADSNFLYAGGYDNGGLRVEKVFASNGTSVWNYTSLSSTRAFSVFDYSGVVYAGGRNWLGGSDYEWRVEALNDTTSANIWNYTTNPSAGYDWVYSVFSDAGFIYALGLTSPGWRLDKLISLTSADNSAISNCVFSNHYTALALAGASSVTQNRFSNSSVCAYAQGSGNTISSNRFDNCGYGVRLNASGNTASSNNISGGDYGIFVESGSNNSAASNEVANATAAGVYVSAAASNAVVWSNVVNSTPTAVSVLGARANVTANRVYNATGGGILVGSSGCRVESNSLAASATGINVTASNNSLLLNNVSGSSANGIWLGAGANLTRAVSNSLWENPANGVVALSWSNNISLNSVNGSAYGIYMDGGSSNNTVANNSIRNFTYGISTYTSAPIGANNTISNNSLADGGDGILVYLMASRLSGNTFFNVSRNPSQAALYVFNCVDTVVSSNSFGAIPYNSIYVESSRNVSVSSNSLNSSGNYGIYSANGVNNSFASNSVLASASYGIFVNGGSSNAVTSNSVNFSGADAIRLQSDGSNITSNIVKSAPSAGIHAYFTSGNRVSYNTISNVSTGVQVSGSQNSVSNNSIVAGEYGVYISASNNNVTANNVSGARAAGVYAAGVSGIRISSNRLSDVSFHCIHLPTGTPSTIISGNFFTRCSSSSINLGVGGSNSQIVNNTFNATNTVSVSSCNNVNISSNAFSGMGSDAISVSSANSAVVGGNTFEDGNDYSVTLYRCNSCNVTSASVSRGRAGLSVSNSSAVLSGIMLSDQNLTTSNELSFDLSNVTVSDLTVSRSGNASVNWPGFFTDRAASINDSNLFLGQYIAALDSASAPDFATGANVTFEGVNTAGSPIYRLAGFSKDYGAVILSGSRYYPAASSFDAGLSRLTFSVASFSSYALQGITPTALSQDASPASPQPPGTTVTFSCNYSDQATGAPVDGASVNVSIDGSAHAASYDAGTGLYSHSTALVAGPHYWFCVASKEAYQTQSGARQAYEIIAPFADLLQFVYPDGTAGCPAVAATASPAFLVKLLVDGVAACDEAGVKLNVTGPANATAALLPTNCSGGIHWFGVNASVAGAYYLTAYSNSTSYSVQPATCAFQETAGRVRAYPDVSLAVVAVSAFAALLLGRRVRGKNH